MLGGAIASAQTTLSVAPASQATLLALSVGEGTVQPLSLPDEVGLPFTVDVFIDGAMRTLALSPHSVRSNRFQLLVQGADGILRPAAPAPSATYQGHVLGYPESRVAASLVDGQLKATILLAPATPLWGVQPQTSVDASASPQAHVVYSSADQLPIPGACATPNLPSSMGGLGLPPTSNAAADADKVAEIACDADTEFFAKNGSSVTSTEQDISSIINAVEAIYKADTGILYEITTIIVRTSEPDPYGATHAGNLLNQFSFEWFNHQSGVPRDVAHLFTGKNLNGGVIGIAWINALCNKTSAYGLSASLFSTNFVFRRALTAHELGHNWSAVHCDGQSTCKIMCSFLGGCGPVTSFGTSAVNSITNKKNSVNCLSDPGPPPVPTISGLSPSSVTAFEPAPITVTGTGMDAVSQVDVGTVMLGPDEFTILSDTSLSFPPPAPLALGPVTVTVASSSGTSNGVSLTFTETSPPEITVTKFALIGQPITWSYGGAANDLGFLLVAPEKTTFPFHGFDVLLDFSILLSEPLDAMGLGGLTIIVPASAAGTMFYSQLVTFDATGISGTATTEFSFIFW